jgi:hypothetical protein
MHPKFAMLSAVSTHNEATYILENKKGLVQIFLDFISPPSVKCRIPKVDKKGRTN